MMKNCDESVEINHHLNWLYIPDHPDRILIIGGSGSGNTMILNLIKTQRPDIDKIYLYIKVPFKSGYQLLINWREKVEIKILKNPKAFTDYSQTIDDVYKNLEDYNPTKKRRVLIVFDYMIADIKSNKEISPTVTEFIIFLDSTKLKIVWMKITTFFKRLVSIILWSFLS